MVVRVTVEVLLRTGLRVSEFTSLPADAVVQIGAAPWLHVPVGKLREDRYCCGMSLEAIAAMLGTAALGHVGRSRGELIPRRAR